MFGGVTKLNENLNTNITKEMLMLLMGPITQIMFWILIYILHIKGYVGINTYEKISIINKILLNFNLMPILPLDGGKLLNNVLDLFLSYNLSHIISIIISIIFLPFMFVFDNKIFTLIIIIFLILNIKDEIIIHKYRLRKLLLERKLNNIYFKKRISINKIEEVKRNYSFIINSNGIKIDEKTYYEKYFLLQST